MLGAVPQITRSEAEAVAEHVKSRFRAITGRPAPDLPEEGWPDLVLAIWRRGADAVESRETEGET